MAAGFGEDCEREMACIFSGTGGFSEVSGCLGEAGVFLFTGEASSLVGEGGADSWRGLEGRGLGEPLGLGVVLPLELALAAITDPRGSLGVGALGNVLLDLFKFSEEGEEGETVAPELPRLSGELPLVLFIVCGLVVKGFEALHEPAEIAALAPALVFGGDDIDIERGLIRPLGVFSKVFAISES